MIKLDMVFLQPLLFTDVAIDCKLTEFEQLLDWRAIGDFVYKGSNSSSHWNFN